MPKENFSGGGEEESLGNGIVNEGVCGGVAFFLLNEGGDEPDVAFKNELGGLELIEGENALVGEKDKLVGLLNLDLIIEIEFAFFFVPNEFFSS